MSHDYSGLMAGVYNVCSKNSPVGWGKMLGKEGCLWRQVADVHRPNARETRLKRAYHTKLLVPSGVEQHYFSSLSRVYRVTRQSS